MFKFIFVFIFANAIYFEGMASNLKIGKKYHGKIDSVISVIDPSCSFVKGYCVTENNIVYCFSRRRDGVIYYIFTIDKKFISDSVCIGDPFSKVRKLYKNILPREHIGFSIYTELPSGWKAIFAIPKRYDSTPNIADTSKIKGFYQSELK